jgi:hypothetical protein
MNKKEIIIPMAFIALSLLFIAVLVLVYFSNGKSKKLIGYKIKVGALLLSLSVASCNSGSRQVTCYSEPAGNAMRLFNTGSGKLEINIKNENIISGAVYYIAGKDFSYSLSDSTGKTLIKENLSFKNDLKTADDTFHIKIDKNLKHGSYKIKLFDLKAENQDSTKFNAEYNILITNE